uniref:Uncharacterized protein n=1 Tax=Ciona intestinalis TaxID=7719 RepID=H2XW08_CIOIN
MENLAKQIILYQTKRMFLDLILQQEHEPKFVLCCCKLLKLFEAVGRLV